MPKVLAMMGDRGETAPMWYTAMTPVQVGTWCDRVHTRQGCLGEGLRIGSPAEPPEAHVTSRPACDANLSNVSTHD